MQAKLTDLVELAKKQSPKQIEFMRKAGLSNNEIDTIYSRMVKSRIKSWNIALANAHDEVKPTQIELV